LVLKLGDRPDRFIILLEGECLTLTPKSPEEVERQRV
jgi:hypothetical protein